MAFTPSYAPLSFYALTPIKGRYMGYYVPRPVPAHALDALMVVRSGRYDKNPGNLAFDLYGSDELFWVFGVRNGLQDLVFDVKRGVTLIIPHPSYIQELFGT